MVTLLGVMVLNLVNFILQVVRSGQTSSIWPTTKICHGQHTMPTAHHKDVLCTQPRMPSVLIRKLTLGCSYMSLMLSTMAMAG